MASNEYEYEHSIGSEMVDDDIQIESGMEDMSIEDLTSRLKLFHTPQRLIYTDEEGLLQLNGDVLSQLSQVNMTINVVGVCGLYRTGKSYLMNWIAGEKTGFNLGDTVRSETKGIWIWCKQHPTNCDQVLVLLDTEGLDDPEKGDPEHDSNMFCLTLLMSSTLIINVKSVFDYTTLDKLAFIASLSDMIKVLDDEAEDKHNAKTIQVASPTLIMCIRDFFLKNTKDGKHQTPNEYLEDNLKIVDLSTFKPKQQEKQLKFNTIKQYIKNYFPKRTCYTIAQPAIGENLQKIEKLDESSLERSFVENINILRSYVYDRKPKYICNASNKPLDGADLTTLITFYVNSLRKGTPLKCQDAYGQASLQRNERVFKMVLTKFRREMDKNQHIESKEKLQSKFLPLFDATYSKYREGSFLYLQNEYEERLLAEMQAYLDMMKNKINKTCMENGTNKLSKMYDAMLRKNQSRYITGETSYSNYEADIEQLKADFFEEKKLYDKDVLYQCFDEFTKSKSDDKMALYRRVTGQKNQDEYVFGDSYVSRLEHFTISKGDLNLNTKCKFYGVPGMGTTYKFESTFNRLCHDRPKAVFIILGGNSITTKTTPNTIFEELKRAVELLKMHGTERVFVCGIVTRGNFREYGMDKTTFDKMRKSINEKLKKFMKSDYVDLGRFVKNPV